VGITTNEVPGNVMMMTMTMIQDVFIKALA
jgi:hypothetical protein